jgi:hypothetical protein
MDEDLPGARQTREEDLCTVLMLKANTLHPPVPKCANWSREQNNGSAVGTGASVVMVVMAAKEAGMKKAGSRWPFVRSTIFAQRALGNSERPVVRIPQPTGQKDCTVKKITKSAS